MRTDPALSLLLFVPLLPACSTSAPRAGDQAARQERSTAEIDALIERGRALLDAGEPAAAEELFARAAAADGGTLRTRRWVLRAWMDQGRSNDTLDALDELDRAGEQGLDMTYLYGMAFARRAEGYVADGVTDSSVQMNFLDAAAFLKRAVDADGASYGDAYLPLARSAWYVQELELARWAADRAVEARSSSPAAWLARGDIAMSQFVTAQQEEAGGERATELWTHASDSLRRAVELFGAPAGDPSRAELARAATGLAHAYLWKGDTVRATEAFATAIAWAPEGFDYPQASELLRGAAPVPGGEPDGFRAALELGKTRLDARADAVRAPTLSWWLGYARFQEAEWARAEEAFQDALPDFPNAWFYVGLARHYRRDPEGALAALHQGWDAEPAALVAVAAGSRGSLRGFEDLTGWCATQEPPRNLEAAFLAELLAEAMPEEPRHWNNLGLFLRDEGERLEVEAYRNKTPEPDAGVLADLYQRSFRAYQRALELNPADPQLLNDTAVMLHYHLEGDPAEAEAMYRRAIELAGERLAQPGLSEDDRARIEQTRSDASDNLDRLLHPEKYQKEAEDTAAAGTNGGG